MSRPPGSAGLAQSRPAAVRRKVEAWLRETDDADAIALRARPEWGGDPVLTVDGVQVRVVCCPTPLAVRAALHERPAGEKLALLTELSDDDLGDSLLARLSRHQVRSIDRWDLVSQVFGGAAVDPGLVAAGRWAGDALVDHAPPGGWPAPQGTVLTREHALRGLAARLLGLGSDQIDSAGLLQWTTDPAALLRFTALPPETIDGLTGFLATMVGPAAEPILAAVRAGHGVDVLPLGLLVGVLWPDPAGGAVSTEAAVARARLEPWFGGFRLAAAQAYQLRVAAEAWVDRALSAADGHARAEADRPLARAEQIAAQIGMTGLLAVSGVLPAGLARRVTAFAAAVRLAVPDGPLADPADVARAEAALDQLAAHRAAPEARVETGRMAVRLLRWLATEDAPPSPTLYDAVARQVREGGWVDRARLDIFAGDPAADPSLAEAYRRLHQAVAARRARHDERFARLLAGSVDADGGALLYVEEVLERVVRPILDRRLKVLLLVLDGMSTAGATELAESVTGGRRWAELSPAGGPRVGVLAALPTVTEVSRCSLFCGRIAAGGQVEERAGWEKLFPDGLLLRKADLRAGAGEALDPAVRSALADPDRRIVAAVVNTVDDALDRAEPGTAVWDTGSVRAVAHLLAQAPDRVVVVLSDHGHVVDRGTDAVTRPSRSRENRWRPAGPAAGDGEVAVAGRRVIVPPSHLPPADVGDQPGGMPGGVVLAWREELRYGPRKAGYHGGASPAEAVIPLLVFSPSDEIRVPGWDLAPVASPAWWREPLSRTRPQPSPAAPAGRSRRLSTPDTTPALFELPEPAPPAVARPSAVPVAAAALAAGRPPLVAALLASDTYAARRDARAPLPDDRVAALLTVLLAGGGRATMDTLAARAGVPAHRISSVVAALRRLLQVEGYPVLEVDPDGVTMKLDVNLLREQFGLEVP